MSTLRIERNYPVSPEELFTYLTETNNLMKWWGPEGVTIAAANLDFTRPGPWSLVFDSPRGAFEMRGVVKSVTPHRAIEFTMNVPGADAPDSSVRFEIEPDATGGSRFTLIQTGITDEMVEMGKRGWVSTLGRLEKLLGEANRAA